MQKHHPSEKEYGIARRSAEAAKSWYYPGSQARAILLKEINPTYEPEHVCM